ncbi:unnamed protein product [Lactuca saligna]|uniref:Disease resistance R13L4/SHOC-2-like LRR domain-containing protein n=1 Tax=Lactuca saligna TaxID=75948 RepID=A0AA35ZLK9_LACSI|nr:unnamed protein product [Lactuca saligna]
MLQIIALLYVMVTVTCAGSSVSQDEECSALFQFKQSLIHQDDAACAASWFQTFDSWKPTSNPSDAGFDCCLWYGVECSNDHEYPLVVALDLSERFLCGHISSSSKLFSLVHLQSLNLAMNDFDESEIPSEIGRLKQLRSLNLSDSGFSGQIPNEISQLVQLFSLDLSRNPLKLESPSGLKKLLQNLTGLKELDLSGVDISSFVPHFLSNFSSLTSIRLSDCSLWNEFPATILGLPKLKILDVASNTNLTGSLPEFYNNSLLEHVNLSFTGFSGRIPSSLNNMTQLTTLGLGSNKFTGFVPSLVGLSRLHVLQLDGNKFENGCFPNWLGKLTKLSELYLANMSINCEIPHFLANLTKLGVVSIERNSLIGHIPSSFFNLTQLRRLNLKYNQLQGPISRSFSNFESLQYLGLRMNNFSGRVDFGIFVGLNNLETLYLSDNNISLVVTNNYTNTTLPNLKVLDLQSCNLKEFPAFLRFQNKMTALFFGFNKIDGLVPVWIWNNSRETLQQFDVSDNSITGFHKNPHFLPWRFLEGFFIGNNHIGGQLPIPPHTTTVYSAPNNYLTGEIPELICEVKSIQLLDLSSNNMSGTLPPCLSNLSNSLLVLDLRRNNFDGTMMNDFTLGSPLRSIDLSENRFTGQLPRSLTNCTNLEVLSLGDNLFDDVFPSWLGTLSNLQVLVLRSNKFSGPLQGSATVWPQFPKLRIIDLSNNAFSSHLHHKYFQTWDSMKSVYDGESYVMETNMSFKSFSIYSVYSMTIVHKGVRTRFEKILTIFTAIDLSCNHFEGEIPQSLQDLQGLQSLNLSNNHFTGQVMQSLGYLKNLESIDLSQNKLSGEIPSQLVQLNFLSIFNVSFNHLGGRIPTGQQFNTFENDSYKGNPGLCGKPLSKKCQGSKASRRPPASNASESLFPSERIDWIIIFCGVGSGLVVGVVIGNLLYKRCSDGFTKRKDIWVRPLCNTRRH